MSSYIAPQYLYDRLIFPNGLPNGTGSILTLGVGNTISTRTNTEFISDLDLTSKFITNDGTNVLKTITPSNFNDVVDGQGKIWLGDIYNLSTSDTGIDSIYGTILNINGLVTHDKTQLIFNGQNGSIQYRKSFYPNSAWTALRTLWDSNNFNPNTKANALENARAIGFSSGSYPTDIGNEYPYFYFDNGTTTGYIPIATQGYVNTRIADNLVNYVTIATPQDINARKSIGGGTSNTYDGAAIEIRGNGSTIFPSLSFHQPGAFAGVMSYRGDDYGYYFMDGTATGFRWLNALGYRKNGSDDNYVLTGAGGHKPISDFATVVNLNEYIPKTHPSYGITQANINDWYWYKGFIDNRSIKPIDTEPLHLQFGFTSISNNNTFPYADFLHFGGYQDASGGKQNLIVINKASWGIRQYQGDWQSTDPYTEYVDYWNTGNLPNPVNQSQLSNYVTIDTPQTIIGSKTFALTSEVRFLGTDLNEVKVYKSTTGNAGIVAGHEFKHYDTSWLVGNKRGGSSDSLGLSFQFSSDGGVTYADESVLIQADGNILTSNFGSANLWNAKVDQSQLGNYVSKSGDTMTGALNIYSNNQIGRWKGADNNTNYLIWRNYGDTKDIAYIGADGNSAAGGGVGDGFAIVAPSGSLQFNAQGGIYINGNAPWTAGNFNPAQYVTQTSLNTQLGNYATLAGTQTFSGTNTFNQSPIVPLGTITSHAINLGQMYDYVDSASGQILGYVSANYMGINQIASTTVLGGIKLITDTQNNIAPNAVTTVTDRSYAVQLNNLNQAIVNVPWIDYGNHATVGYAKLTGAAQTFTNVNTFTSPPKVPSANNPDEAIPFGQAEEIAITTVRDNFLTRTTTLPTDITYDLSSYGSPMVTNIVIKGNPIGDIYIDGLDQGMTIKIMNTTALNLIVRFDGGSLSTGIGQKTWIEVHRDSDGDLIKNDTQNTIIIT